MILLNFKIQTDPLIQARWPDFVLIYKNKKNMLSCGFAVPIDHNEKIKGKG